jgi:hypothetical protein
LAAKLKSSFSIILTKSAMSTVIVSLCQRQLSDVLWLSNKKRLKTLGKYVAFVCYDLDKNKLITPIPA